MSGGELLPCPFCGGVAELRHEPDPRVADRYGWAVRCKYGADAMVEGCLVTAETMPMTKAGAIRAWNRRPSAPLYPSRGLWP
jgi:hypothetical protein